MFTDPDSPLSHRALALLRATAAGRVEISHTFK